LWISVYSNNPRLNGRVEYCSRVTANADGAVDKQPALLRLQPPDDFFE